MSEAAKPRSAIAVKRDDVWRVLRAPVISEKSTESAEKRRAPVFRVSRDADKRRVKQAVEELFSVKVDDVRFAVAGAKKRVFAGRRGRRSGWKKAYVRLAPGHDINFAEMS